MNQPAVEIISIYQELLADLLQSANEGIGLFFQGNIHPLNQAFTSVSGISRTVSLSDFASSALHPDLVNNFFESWQSTNTPKAVLIAGSQKNNDFMLQTFHSKNGAKLFKITSAVDSGLENSAGLQIPQSREKLRQITASSSEAIAVIFQNKVIIANEALCSLTGYAMTELVGRRFDEICTAQDRRRISNAVQAAETHILKHGVTDKNGTHISAETHFRSLRLEEKTLRIAEVCDISRLKKIETALRTSERRFNAVFHNSFDFICLIDIDGFILEINSKSKEFLGSRFNPDSPPSFNDLTWWSRPDDKKKSRSAVMSCLKGEVVRFEAGLTDNAGNLHPADFSVTPVIDDTGFVTMMIAEGRLIGDLKKAEEALKTSEGRYRILFEQVSTAIAHLNISDWRLENFNAGFSQLTGLSAEELQLYSFRDLIYPDDRMLFDEAAAGAVAHKEPALEIRIKRPSGMSLWVQCTLTLLEISGNRPQLVLMAQDVTERRNAQRELADQHDFLHTLIETIPLPVYTKDTEERYTACNSAYENYLGLSWDKIVGKTADDILTAENARAERIRDKKLLQEIGSHRSDQRYTGIDGSIRDAIIQLATTIDAEGRITGLVGAIFDITERKQAEDAILERERQLRAMISSLDDIVFEFSHDLHYLNVWCSDEQRLFLPKGRLLGRTVDETLPEELAAAFKAASKRVLETGLPAVIEYTSPNGTDWYSARFSPLKEKNQSRVVCTVRDITERRLADEQLRHSEITLRAQRARLQAAIDSIPFVFWMTGRDSSWQLQNADSISRWGKLTGKNLDSIPLAAHLMQTLQSRIERALTGAIVDEEERIESSEGPSFKREIAAPVHLDGEVIGIVGMSIDLTQQRRAELKAHEAEEKFLTAFRSTPDSIIITRIIDGAIIDVNEGFEKMTLWPRSDVIGKTSAELGIWDPISDENFMRTLIRDGEQHGVEMSFLQRSGARRDALIAGRIVPIAGEPCLVSVSHDVTDRKRYEIELKERLDFERLLTSIGARFINLKPEDLRRSLENALAEIGAFTSAEHSLVMLFSSSEETMHCIVEWCDKDRESVFEQLRKVDLISFPLLKMKLLSQTPSILLEEDASIEIDARKLLQQTGLLSSLHVPISQNGRLLGYLAMTSKNPQHVWPATLVPLLQVVAEIVSNTLDRQSMESALRESELVFRQLAENIRDVFFLYDLQANKALYVNPSVEELLGITPSEFLEHPELLRSLLGDRSKLGAPSEREITVRTAGGEKRMLLVKTSPVENDGGATVRIAGVAADITEIQNAKEKEREQELALLQAEKMATLGTLVAGMAHEISNPNNFVMFNNSVLGKVLHDVSPLVDKIQEETGAVELGGIDWDNLRPKLPQLVEGIQHGAERIKNIVQQLKDYSRLGEPRLDEHVDISECAEAASLILASKIRKTTRHFENELSAQLPRIIGNKMQIEQVLINLIDNACDAGAGYESPLSIKASIDNGNLVVEVIDQGKGIAPADLKQIFDPFFTTKRNEGGTGLGLAISQRIVNAHGGRLVFTSSPEGTAAKMILPIPK